VVFAVTVAVVVVPEAPDELLPELWKRLVSSPVFGRTTTTPTTTTRSTITMPITSRIFFLFDGFLGAEGIGAEGIGAEGMDAGTSGVGGRSFGEKSFGMNRFFSFFTGAGAVCAAGWAGGAATGVGAGYGRAGGACGAVRRGSRGTEVVDLSNRGSTVCISRSIGRPFCTEGAGETGAAATGAGAAAGGTSPGLTIRVPHLLQNIEPSGTFVPHLVQYVPRMVSSRGSGAGAGAGMDAGCSARGCTGEG